MLFHGRSICSLGRMATTYDTSREEYFTQQKLRALHETISLFCFRRFIVGVSQRTPEDRPDMKQESTWHRSLKLFFFKRRV